MHDGVHDGVQDLHMTDTMDNILNSISGTVTTSQLLNQLGYTRRTRNFSAAIKSLMTMGIIEMTLPDKPRSKNQKYRLTDKGIQMLKVVQSPQT